MSREYRRASWVDPRLELRASVIAGSGLVAREPIAEGDVIGVWGGVVVTFAEVALGMVRPHSVAEIEEGLSLATPVGEPESAADFMNHSCDANVWMVDEATLVSRRKIEADEEVTIDYALWGGNPPWERCFCGSAICRGRVTRDDWRPPALQDRYRGHWSPYIARRIESSTSI